MQREEIRLMVERDRSAKAIVFSQFTSFLELIDYTLGKVISLCYVSVIILAFVFKQNETLFCLQHSVGLVAFNWWEQCPRQLEMLPSINSEKIQIAKFS